MPKSKSFINQLLKRLDRIDRKDLESHLANLGQEAELDQGLLDSLHEGVVLFNDSQEIVRMNQQATSWLQLKEGSKGRFGTIADIQEPDIAEFITEGYDLNVGANDVRDIQVLEPADLILRATVTPFVRESRRYLILILEDISRDVSHHLDSARMARIETLLRLAAGVAHEIGNPLNSMGIHRQIIEEELKSIPEKSRGKIDKSIQVMGAEMDRLDRIIKTFLKATRKTPLRFQVEELNNILQDALDFLKPELETNKIKIDLKQVKTIPSFLLDKDRIHQILINLIKNAMESMQDGGNLKISMRHKNKVALIQVRDEGIGIAEDDLPHIFDAYWTTKEEGSGLGLMTVYNAVAEHGGRIEVDSTVGKGTSFLISLPMHQPNLQLPEYSDGKKSKRKGRK